MKKRTERLLGVLAAFLVALALGLGSAALGVRCVGLGAMVRNGAWSASLLAGSPEAGIYTRAAVAVGGLFALSRKETIYFTAFVDDRGETLRSSCDYLLEGQDLDARWWSLTVYGEDHYLIASPGLHRYSYNMLNLARRADRSYQVHLSRREQTGNWLPTGASAFSVTLRLYNPSRSVRDRLATVALPSITRVACR